MSSLLTNHLYNVGDDMAAEFAYIPSVKNLPAIFTKIRNAGSPPRFTIEFLKSLGFPSSTDRSVIGLLKALGFLTSDGTPTERYNAYRDSNRSGKTMAVALRDGWSAVFLVEQRAYEKSPAQLIEIFKSITGKGEAVAKKMASTFKALCGMADWSESIETPMEDVSNPPQKENGQVVETSLPAPKNGSQMTLHHDVHVHLPATSDVSVYTAIFRALKVELLD